MPITIKVNTNIRIKKNDMKVFPHYMGNEKDWNLSEDGFHEEGFRTRTGSKLPHLNVYLRSQSVSQSTYRLGIIAYKFFIKNFINSSLTLEISPLS